MTEKTQSTFAILSLLALSLGTGTAALAKPAGFALAREGKPVATIVVAKEATPAADLAAAELKYHIRKITGATLPIVTDETPVTGPRILVDESAATRSLGLRSDAFKPLERLVRFSKDTLILIGRDESRAVLGRDEVLANAETYMRQFFTIVDNGESFTQQPGLKDTVLVPGLSELEIIASMDNPGRWMAHCHILEHAELGMMGEIRINPAE